MLEELKAMVGPNEKILYEGKPNKKCYIFESIFNPLLPFAIIWAVFDLCFIGGAFFTDFGFGFVIIPFMLIHMMPVWMYIGGVLLTIRRYKNTGYIVTDRAIYVSEGAFTRNYNTKPFAELSHINLHRGIFDQWFNVGDVVATTSQRTENGAVSSISISSISNYMEVFNIVKKVQTDIYTDVMYPNAKRPKENPGYNTEYKGL